MRSCRVPREERRGKEGGRVGGGKFSNKRERDSSLARVWSAYRKDNETEGRSILLVVVVVFRWWCRWWCYADWRTSRGVWWLCALRLFPRWIIETPPDRCHKRKAAVRLEMTGFRVAHTLCTRPLLRSVSYVYSWVNTRRKKKKKKEKKEEEEGRGKKKKKEKARCRSLLSTSVLSSLPFQLSLVITVVDCQVGGRQKWRRGQVRWRPLSFFFSLSLFFLHAYRVNGQGNVQVIVQIIISRFIL